MNEYSEFVNCLQRLYPERITIEKLDELLSNGKINQDEYNYIMAE